MAISKITDIDGDGSDPSGGFNYSGGDKTFAFQGTFNNATVKIQASFADGAANSWIYLTDSEGSAISITAPGIINLDIGKCKLKFVTTGSGASTDIEVRIS